MVLRLSRQVAMLLLTTSRLACSERAVLQDDAGGQPAFTDGGLAQADGTTFTGGGGPNDGCVVAIRVDDCCTTPQPVHRSAVDADPCLVLYPAIYPVPQICKDRWPVDCAAVDCTYVEPPSRLAGPADGGSCQFVDECQTDVDCALGINTRGCCACATAVPKALFEVDRCTTPLQGPLPDPSCADCSNVRCDACGPPSTPRCRQVEGALNRCRDQ